MPSRGLVVVLVAKHLEGKIEKSYGEGKGKEECVCVCVCEGERKGNEDVNRENGGEIQCIKGNKACLDLCELTPVRVAVKGARACACVCACVSIMRAHRHEDGVWRQSLVHAVGQSFCLRE